MFLTRSSQYKVSTCVKHRTTTDRVYDKRHAIHHPGAGAQTRREQRS